MTVPQRIGGSVLIGLLALACNEQSMTDQSSGTGPAGQPPSFLVEGASVVVGFEPLEAGAWYVPGTIHGQDDWSSFGPYDHEVTANSYGYTSFGLQSLRISNAVASGSFGDQTFSKRTPNYAGESTSGCGAWCQGTRHSHFEAEWDVASTVPGAQQPGLSVVASPDRGDGARMSWVQMLDTPTGLDINFFDVQGTSDPANFSGPVNIAAGLSRSVPHTIKITMDLLEGPSNDIVKVYVNGSLRHIGTSWENYYRYDSEAAAHLGKPPIVNRILFRTGGPAAPATAGFGFLVDNLSLGTVAVSKAACTEDGWQSLARPDGGPFKNQGDCIQFANTGR